MDEIAFSRLRAGLGDGLMDAMLRAEDRPKVVPPPKVPVSAPMDVALIPVVRNVIGDEEVNSISARDLYVFLGVKKDFSNWIKGRISKYNFTEDVDYILLAQIGEAQPCTSSSISANKKEYIITLNMAKELCRLDRGPQAKVLFDSLYACTLAATVAQPQTVPTSTAVALIPVNKYVIGDYEVNSVDARDLYKFLGIVERFSKWTKRYVKHKNEYGFVINSDFCTSRYTSINGHKIETFILTLDMAKEISMLSKTKRGQEARQYFIECERVKDEVKAKPTNSIKIPDFNNPLESAIAFAESSERAAEVTRLYIGALQDNASIISERDEALRTKHYINNKKTASAMGTAGAMAKKVKKLEAELRLVDWIGERSM